MKTKLFENTNTYHLYNSYKEWIEKNQNIKIINIISPKDGFLIVTYNKEK
jgi:hypothetical protein